MDRREWMKKIGGTAAAAVMGANAKLPDWQTKSSSDASFTPRQTQDRLPPDEETVLLDSNENPLGPSPMAKKVVMNAFDRSFRYPGEAYRTLLEQIAEREDAMESVTNAYGFDFRPYGGTLFDEDQRADAEGSDRDPDIPETF
jgi:hypothetical protein